MSKLEKLPQKNLKFILKRMDEGLDKTSLISYHNQKVIKEIFDDIGMVVRG
jgi:ABC-type multidrug transport system ATPase subunit